MLIHIDWDFHLRFECNYSIRTLIHNGSDLDKCLMHKGTDTNKIDNTHSKVKSGQKKKKL